MRPLRFALLVASATLFAAAATAQSWSSVRGTIEGVVRSETGAPIVGAVVRLSGMRQGETRSGAAGWFAFRHLDPGVYTVAVEAEDRVSSWVEDMELLPAQVLRVVVDPAPGKPTAVTVTAAPVLDVAASGPVARSDSKQLRELPRAPEGARADLPESRVLAGELSTGRPEGLASIGVDAPPEWTASAMSRSGGLSTALAGTSRGREIVLLTEASEEAWRGRVGLEHTSRSLEGRDRGRLEALSESDSVQLRGDQDRSSERGTLFVGGGVRGRVAMSAGVLATSRDLETSSGACAGCAPSPRFEEVDDLDQQRARLAWRARTTTADVTLEAARWRRSTFADPFSRWAQLAVGGGLLDHDRLALRHGTFSRRASLELEVSRGDRLDTQQGFLPGLSGFSFAAGVGGEPTRGAGSEEPSSRGSLRSRTEPDRLLLVAERDLGRGARHRLRAGAGALATEHEYAARLETSAVLWGMPSAGSSGGLGHLLVHRSEGAVSAEARGRTAFVEDGISLARWTVRAGLRAQRGDLRAIEASPAARLCDACTIRLRDEVLPRLALAFDPRGLGQERLTLTVGRYSEAADGLLPVVSSFAGPNGVTAYPLQDAAWPRLLESPPQRAALLEGDRGSLSVPPKVVAARSLVTTLAGEHLLLPGLIVGLTLEQRLFERSPGARLDGDGWVLADLGHRPRSGVCGSSDTEMRAYAGWRGGRSSLHAALEWLATHGTRSAACTVDRPGQSSLRGTAPFAPAVLPGSRGTAHPGEGSLGLRLFGHRQFAQRWTVGGRLGLVDLEGPRVGLEERLQEGVWTLRPVPLEADDTSLVDLDLALRYRASLGALDASVTSLHVSLELINALDRRGGTAYFDRVLLSPSAVASGPADPRAGRPATVQPARAVRLGLGVSW